MESSRKPPTGKLNVGIPEEERRRPPTREVKEHRRLLPVQKLPVQVPRDPEPPPRRKPRLNRCHCPTDLNSCLTEDRLHALRHGQKATDAETTHMIRCGWCWYLVNHEVSLCATSDRVLEWSLGADLTPEEEAHHKECPVCAWEYEEVRDVPAPAPIVLNVVVEAEAEELAVTE